MINDLNTKIKHATALKKALQPKRLIPLEKEDAPANPYKFSSEDIDELLGDRADDLNRSQRYNYKNNLLQDELEKYDNPFPIDVFPDFIASHILDLEKCICSPKEYIAGGILTAISGAIGNKFHVELKSDVTSSPMLYTVIIGSTGANKTLPLKLTLAPLFKKDEEYSKLYSKEYKSYLKSKAEDKNDADEPEEKRCIVNDITMEALLDVLVNNDVTLYCDEFQSFLSSMNKYRAGDDMEKFISIWSSTQIRSDRKNKRGKVVTLPFASCIGTIQPDVLINFLTKNNTNNGFNERLLYVVADKNINTEWNTHDINKDLQQRYMNTVNQILDIPHRKLKDECPDPEIIKLDKEALAEAMNWQHKNDKLCRMIADAQTVAIYKKLEIYLLRFSLILCILELAGKVPLMLTNKNYTLKIKRKHVLGAIKITEYFRNSAKYIFTLKPKTTAINGYEQTIIEFFEILTDRFTTVEALDAGQKLNLSERSVYNYLKSKYFKKTEKRGFYEKVYQLK